MFKTETARIDADRRCILGGRRGEAISSPIENNARENSMSDARIEHCERRVDSVEGWRSEASGSLDYLRRLAEASEARLTEECRANAEERRANDARLAEERNANAEERRANAEERRANDVRLAEERRANDVRLAEERKAYDALLAAERKASRTERYWAMGVYVVLVLGVIGGPIIAKMIS